MAVTSTGSAAAEKGALKIPPKEMLTCNVGGFIAPIADNASGQEVADFSCRSNPEFLENARRSAFLSPVFSGKTLGRAGK